MICVDFLLKDVIFPKMDISLQNSAAPYRIACLLIDGFALLSYSATIEPLRAANTLASKTLYEIFNMPVSGARAVSSSGAEIRANAHIGERVDFDLVLVIAGGNPVGFDDKRVFQWLRHISNRGVPIGGVSGGPVILAAAGLMKGKRMTAHWQHAEALNRRHPTLATERSLYVFDRDRMTCAGGTAPLNMMHSMVASHHGNAFANRISEWFSYQGVDFGHEPSGVERDEMRPLGKHYNTYNRGVLTAISCMNDNLAEPLSLVALAKVLSLSPRQINRLFHDHLQCSTMAFYRQLRLEKARQLLIDSSLSITDIALATGFANSAHFSFAYRKQFGEKPSADRAKTQAS